ncbi:MAG: hypothetical protein J2P37_20280 [Ktedonobacteraceae bacterium]|nr:hypothetical protein [Ktedonobacteraceae bacterium]
MVAPLVQGIDLFLHGKPLRCGLDEASKDGPAQPGASAVLSLEDHPLNPALADVEHTQTGEH